jgi:hypothetical protein
MKKSHGTGWVSDSPTPAQLKELFAQIERGRVTKERFQAFLRGETEITGLIADWENFYQEVFGIEIDFSNLQVPTHQKGFDRLIVVAEGITLQRIYDRCKEHFPCWKWTEKSLSEVTTSERTVKGAYALWFRDVVEADEDLKNLSANNLKEKGVPGITLEERLLYELKYFRETGEHLDRENITLCAGSRCSDGYVPRACWLAGLLLVCWFSPEFHFGRLRARRAVL